MVHHKPEEARSEPERRRIKREVLIMFLVLGAILIGGAVYTSIRGDGSPGTEFQGPVQVHSDGPASMPGPPAMERRPAGEPPPGTPTQP